MAAVQIEQRLLDALARERGRVERLREDVERGEAGPDHVLRLAEAARDPDDLAGLVRWVRRLQPARRGSGEFMRATKWARLSKDLQVFVQWAVHGVLVDGVCPPSWFADARHWIAPVRGRMAGLYLCGADALPLLAFEPFPPDHARPERLFRWFLAPVAASKACRP